jgi:hypothetical protein
MRMAAKTSLLTVALSIAGFLLQAQQPAANGTIRGTAQLAESGAPAAGVILSLMPAPVPNGPPPFEYIVRDPKNLHAIVDATGSFSIDNIPPGDYTILPHKSGYVLLNAPIEYPISLGGLPVHIYSGTNRPIAIQLARGGSIEGTVRAAEGQTADQAVQGIAVNAEIQTTNGSYSRIGGTGHTDAQGRYTIDGLPTGRYVVFIAIPGKMVPTTRGLLATQGIILCAPGTVRVSAAQQVAVNMGKTDTGVDIEFPSQGLYIVSGKVVDTEDKPITEGLVRLYPTGEPGLSRANPIGKDGEFSFDDVLNEQYTVALEPSPTQEYLGPANDKTGIRVRILPSPYLPASADVHVSGQNPAPLTLTVKRNAATQQ